MSIFHRKSTWERVLDGVVAASSADVVRRAAKVTLGVIGGAVGATAASAAVSTARHREQS
jgi:hypothetical protein